MSTETPTTGNKPSHELFVVSGKGDKSRWTRIGAAWPTESGNGFNIDFEALPAGTTRVVMLEPKREAKAA
jgi:hypothetical protein